MALVLPQFPLEIVAFPGLPLPLHIFEPRYKQLFQDCVQQDLKFGIIPVIDGKLQDLGTRMKISKIVRQYDDGRLDVACKGEDLFRVLDFRSKASGKLYPEATIELVKGEHKKDSLATDSIKSKVTELFDLMKISKPPQQIEAMTLFQIAKMIGLSIEEEFELLQLQALASRQEKIIQHLVQIIPKVREAERVRRHIEMNGQFLNLQPPKV